MKKVLLIWVFLCAAGLSLAAQNNPYEISDSCYPFFVETEQLVGKAGFREAAGRLLQADRKSVV